MEIVEVAKVKYGNPYKARVVLENKARQTRTLKAVMTSSSVFYTGVTANPIKKAQGVFELSPGQRETLAMTVHPDEYMELLVDYCMVKFHVMITVVETNQTWSDEDDFILEKPKLGISIPDNLSVGRKAIIQISLRNPLSRSLTGCQIGVECPGTLRLVKQAISNIGPGQTTVHKLSVVPRKAGSGTLVALFSSKEMIDVHGTVKINIQQRY